VPAAQVPAEVSAAQVTAEVSAAEVPAESAAEVGGVPRRLTPSPPGPPPKMRRGRRRRRRLRARTWRRRARTWRRRARTWRRRARTWRRRAPPTRRARTQPARAAAAAADISRSHGHPAPLVRVKNTAAIGLRCPVSSTCTTTWSQGKANSALLVIHTHSEPSSSTASHDVASSICQPYLVFEVIIDVVRVALGLARPRPGPHRPRRPLPRRYPQPMKLLM